MVFNQYVIVEGQVVVVENEDSVYNESSANRIKVRIQQDKDTTLEDLPWAFPLMPKTIQSTPKVGEGVLVFLSEIGNHRSNRFYLGPIISQPQYMEYCPYNNGTGPAMAFLQGGNDGHKLKNITNDDSTTGAFPKSSDVALIGRKTEDVVLKDGEIDIRCGIRDKMDGSDEELKGNIRFNNQDPSYIQLKYKQNLTTKQDQQSNSMVNIVADKVNVISHKDVNQFNLTDKTNLIKEEELDEIMSKLHQLPYGDILVRYLEILRMAIVTHGHNFSPGTPPIDYGAITESKNLDFNKILSKNVRIS